jgi:hypothetical protein
MAKKKRAPKPKTQYEEFAAQLSDIDEDILTADGYEDALVGYIEMFASDGHHLVACYDREKCMQCLMNQGMTYDKANEWFEFNTLGAWPGRQGPVFLTLFTKISTQPTSA